MSHLRKKLSDTINLAGEIILGKERQIRLSLACLLARGHLLIEDLPGVGKTTLAHVISQVTSSFFEPFSAVLGGVAGYFWNRTA